MKASAMVWFLGQGSGAARNFHHAPSLMAAFIAQIFGLAIRSTRHEAIAPELQKLDTIRDGGRVRRVVRGFARCLGGQMTSTSGRSQWHFGSRLELCCSPAPSYLSLYQRLLNSSPHLRPAPPQHLCRPARR